MSCYEHIYTHVNQTVTDW